MKKAGLILLLIIHLGAAGQNRNAGALLDTIKKKYAAVKDYTVDATIVVDVWFLNMPEKKAKIYYKNPGKIHVETKGFALLPKKAASFDPVSFIGTGYTAFFMNSEKLGNVMVDVIKTIPNDPKSDIILSTFWIDPRKKQIRRLEINSRTAGTFHVDIEYNRLPYDLPLKLSVVFDVKETEMPKSFTGEPVKKNDAARKKADGKGKVTITYSNYVVNKGIDDKVFREKKK